MSSQMDYKEEELYEIDIRERENHWEDMAERMIYDERYNNNDSNN